jgi:hypothetical protein
MSAVRDAIGLLRLGAVNSLVGENKNVGLLRVQTVGVGFEEQWEIRTKAWRDKMSKVYSITLDATAKMTFLTRGKRRVGIHTASDQDGNWIFLFQDRHLDVLVLLGEDAEGILHDYVLPPKLVQELRSRWKTLMDPKGRVSFTVRRTTNSAILSLGGIDIQQYQSNYEPLQQRNVS